MKTGFEPGLPADYTSHLMLEAADVQGMMGDSGWSETVNGVRLRLLAPGKVKPGDTFYVHVLVQNETPNSIAMPILSMKPAIGLEGEVAEIPRANNFSSWRLPPDGTVLISIAVSYSGDARSREFDPDILEVTTMLPRNINPGLYRLIFSLDSTRHPAIVRRWQLTATGSPLWQGAITSPSVVIDIAR